MHIDPRMRRYLFEDLTEEGISEMVELIEQKPVVIDISLKLDDLLIGQLMFKRFYLGLRKRF